MQGCVIKKHMQVKPKGGVLVHGVYAPEYFMVMKIEHAWVELPDNIVFDGELQRFYRKEDYYREYKTEKIIEVDSIKSACLELIKHDYYYGPWHNEAKRQRDEFYRLLAIQQQYQISIVN